MTHNCQTGAQFSMHGFQALLLMAAAMVVIHGIPAMRIVRRVGFSSCAGLLAAVPVVNTVALPVFDFRDRPLDEGR